MSIIGPGAQGIYRGTIAFGLIFLAFGGTQLYKRGSINIQGKIISSTTECQQQKSRCATRYTVEKSNGSLVSYTAGFSNGGLARELPKGTYIDKEKWHIEYSINGSIVDDFPTTLYTASLLIGILLISWSAFNWIRL